jgi:uncharacterized repeat protein (TIGR03803 family)
MRSTQRQRRSSVELPWVTVTLTLGVLLVIASPTTAYAQTFEVLHEFQGVDGLFPLERGVLLQGTDGNFYGTTASGGTNSRGTVFNMDASGTITILHTFSDSPDGAWPASGLIQAEDGALYGTTIYGGGGPCGAVGCGTLYAITTTGQYTQLWSFSGMNGQGANGALIQSSNGYFYGTTWSGGTPGYGEVFKMDAAGTVTTVHEFSLADGAHPNASLIQAKDGLLYGTTAGGGPSGRGTIFSVDPTDGSFSLLHAFGSTEGLAPLSALLEASDGHLYGTTSQGGGPGCGGDGCGTTFRVDPGGANFLQLHAFNEPFDGSFPRAALIQASNGTFYGTTTQGAAGCGRIGCGTVFAMDAAGAITILHRFSGADGAAATGIIQGVDDAFYGTTIGGGSGNGGVVYRLTIP